MMARKDGLALRQTDKGRYTLDVRGYTCPYPEILARRALDAIAPDDLLEIILDNAPSCETVPAAAEEMKHEVIEVKKVNDREWQILIKKH